MKWTLFGIIETAFAAVLLLWLLGAYFGGTSGRTLATKYDLFEKALHEKDLQKAATLADYLAEKSRKPHGFMLQAAAIRSVTGDAAAAKSACRKVAGDASAPARDRAAANAMLAAFAAGKDASDKSLETARKYAASGAPIGTSSMRDFRVISVSSYRFHIGASVFRSRPRYSGVRSMFE